MFVLSLYWNDVKHIGKRVVLIVLDKYILHYITSPLEPIFHTLVHSSVLQVVTKYICRFPWLPLQ